MSSTPKADKPFAPPSPRTLAVNLKPDDCEAQDVAEKLLRDKLPDPVGFVVNHDYVGPWPKNTRVSVAEVRAHLADKVRRMTGAAEQDAALGRLVGLNAFVPFFE